MNIEIANRLYEYRKKSGLSQEELAEKLNITRQSVSKWERAESAPDTDNLILLAKIYGVTIDELLNVEKPIEEMNENNENNENKYSHITFNIENNYFEDDQDNHVMVNENGLLIQNDSEKYDVYWENVYTKKKNQYISLVNAYGFGEKYCPSSKTKKIKDSINGAMILIITIIYLVLCSLNIQEWGKFWVLFVYYPAITTFIDVICYKDASKFAFPVFISGVYLTLGMYFSLWHPYWFLFILVPIYYIIVDLFKKKVTVYYKDIRGLIRNFTINKGDIKVIDETKQS